MFEDRISALEAELQAVEVELADPATLARSDRLRDLSRRHKELDDIVRTWHDLTAAREDVAAAREMLTEASGDERELVREEAEEAEARVGGFEAHLQALLLPKDPNEGRNVIMEIRGAVGGDEANLFARNLYDMYLRFAAARSGRSRSSPRTPRTRTASTRPSSWSRGLTPTCGSSTKVGPIGSSVCP